MHLPIHIKSLTSALVCVLLGALVSACAPNARQIAPGVTVSTNSEPIQPGQVRISVKNPNRNKWTARIRTGARDGTVNTGYTCKVLSCPEPASVIVSHRLIRGPRLDKAAMEKMAKETVPKLTQAENLHLQVRTDNKAKLETLSSATMKFGDKDGILQETKTSIGTNARHTAKALIFAGRMMVIIQAEAGDRVTARKAVDEFSQSFTVEEGAPL